MMSRPLHSRASTYSSHRRSGLGLIVLAALMALALPAMADDTLTVQVDGRVAHPGAQTLPAGSRLADAVLQADVLPDAYPPGAAWLRSRLRDEQTRLKAGLLYEAGVLRGQARLDGDTDLARLATRLERAWHAMPVTGRETQALLDPRPLEISDRNHLLDEGDRVVYPPRPHTVRITGAVVKTCTVPFTGLKAARAYLATCPRAAAADPDWLVVIQPDGRIQRRGIAAWNRQPPQPLAPGAVLYVPLKAAALPASVREDFNRDAAHFLATQLLSTDTRAGGTP